MIAVEISLRRNFCALGSLFFFIHIVLLCFFSSNNNVFCFGQLCAHRRENALYFKVNGLRQRRQQQQTNEHSILILIWFHFCAKYVWIYRTTQCVFSSWSCQMFIYTEIISLLVAFDDHLNLSLIFYSKLWFVSLIALFLVGDLQLVSLLVELVISVIFTNHAEGGRKENTVM